MKKPIQSPSVKKSVNKTAISKLFRTFGLMAIFLLINNLSQAAVFTWVGTADTNWNNAANWVQNAVPTAADEVGIFGGASKFPIISTTVTVKSIYIESGAKLTVSSTATLNINGSPFSGIQVLGELKSSGIINITNTNEFGLYVEGSNAKAYLYGDTYISNTNSDGVLVGAGLLVVDIDVSSFNDLTPTLSINDVSGNGIRCLGGTINIWETNSGLFTPFTSVNIGTTGTVSGHGILNNSDFNFTAGTITIEDTGSSKDGVNNASSGDFSIGSNGELKIGSTTAQIGRNGILNDGAITADGLISINNTGDDGLEVSSTGEFTLNGTGQLNIGSASAEIEDTGILNEGTFSSSGQITINNTVNNGITITAGSFTNDGTIDVGSLAAISITGIYLKNAGTSFLNNGLIKVEDCNNGLSLFSNCTFTNSATGVIEIGQAGIGDTKIGLTISDLSSFYNDGGELNIDQSTSAGMHVQYNGIFENKNGGLVILGASSTFGNWSISHAFDGQFTNASCSGIIQYGENRISFPALTNNGWIIDHSSLNNTIGTNNGIVQNLNGGAFNITTNNGTVVTNEGIVWTGCSNDNWTTAANWAGGVLPVATDDVIIPPAANFPAIGSGQSASIRSLKIMADGQLNCFGNLTLSGAAGAGIDNEGTLLNFNHIMVDNTGADGIYNHGAGVFSNSFGTQLSIGINGGNIGEAGIYNYNGGTFTCLGGNIGIDNCDGFGIRNQGAQFNILTSAFVQVGTFAGNIGDFGIFNYLPGSMFTIDGGKLLVDNTDNWGIFNDAAFTIKNNGKLEVGADVVDDGFVNASDGTFTNADCSQVSISQSMFNDGTATNEGYFYFDTNSSHANTGTFTNNGVMNFAQLPVMPGIANNDIIASPTSFACGANNGALGIGGSNSFTILDEWFNDVELTDKAGDYDQATNTFTPTNLLGNSNKLYFTATDGTCTYLLSITVSSSASNTLTWTGAVDSDWENFCNWSPQAVPTATNTVVIPDVTNDPVIGGGTNALAKTVKVEANGLLTIQQNGNLNVSNPPSHGMDIKGNVVNNGIIDLGQNGGHIGLAGITMTGSLTNNSGGIINIDNAALIGLTVSNAGFLENIGTINIGQNGGQYNIKSSGLNVSDTIVNSGIINIDNVEGTGFYGGGNAKTFNTGNINIGQNGGSASIKIYGMQLGNHQFFNQIGGIVNIDNTNSTGVHSTSGYFSNKGQLNIGMNGGTDNIGLDGISLPETGKLENKNGGIISIDNTDGYGIHTFLGGTLLNDGCSRIYLFNRLAVDGSSNSFTNNGLLHYDASTISISNKFTNNGVVVNVQGKNFSSGTNNDLIVAPASGTCAITDILQIGGANDFTASSEWYSDEAMTIVAGDYDQATNTFYPTNLSGGIHNLYFTATDGNCTFDAQIEVETTSETSMGTSTWTGAFNSDWNIPCNWSPTIVPTLSDNVIIPNTANAPIIENGVEAFAQKVTIESSGSLTIGDNGILSIDNGSINYGVVNNGSLVINDGGSLNVDNARFDGISNNGTIDNSGDISVGMTASVGQNGVDNKNTLFNRTGGQLTIRHAGNVGFRNFNAASTATNEVGATITIDQTGWTGLWVLGGSFTNQGEISIGENGNVNNVGLLNAANFTNESGGTITVGSGVGTGKSAIENTGTFLNSGCTSIIHILSDNPIKDSGTFTNNGILIENASGNSNITNNNLLVQNLNGGTFTITNNNSSLTTSTGTNWTGCTDTDWNTADNWSTGSVPAATDEVVIPNAANDPVINGERAAVAKSVTVETDGQMTIENNSSLTIDGAGGIGFANSGTVSNNGTLQIDNTGSDGIHVLSGGSFTNKGQILIGGNGIIGNLGLLNEANFTNETGGTVAIDGTDDDAIMSESGSTFSNSGTIDIGQNGGNVGSYGFYFKGLLTNSSSGIINIDNTDFTALTDHGSSILENEGIINIGQNGGADNINNWGIRVWGQLNNSGIINIDYTRNQGIIGERIITNTGTINIGQNGVPGSIGSTGLELAISNETYNYNGGVINIDNTDKFGILAPGGDMFNEGQLNIGMNGGTNNISNDGISLSQGGTLENKNGGVVNIDNTNSYSIHTFLHGKVLNDTCSKIHLSTKLGVDANTSYFTNNGLLHLDADDSSISNKFTNNGIVEDIQGTFSGGTNNEIIVSPVTAADCFSVNPAFQLGTTVDFSILGIFTDENCTQSAGTYDVATNTFTPSLALPQASTVFYVKIEDMLGGCTRIVEWEVDSDGCCPQLVTCYLDSDSDNYGDPAISQEFCQICGTGYVSDNTDCDDNDPKEFPGQVWYLDLDDDGYSDGTSQTACERPANYFTENELMATSGDCDDFNPFRFPGNPEVCDGVDNNCDGQVDEGLSGETYTGSVFLYTQSDVDNWPYCYSHITGELYIKGSGITDLIPLSNISTVGQSVTVFQCYNLPSLNGLNNLTSVGSNLDIASNTLIENVDPLSNVSSIGNQLIISGNSSLTNLDGLSNINAVPDNLKISSNGNLPNLDGLANIMFVGNDLTVTNNGILTDCCGIHYLIDTPGAVNGTISISNNETGCDSGAEIATDCGDADSDGVTVSDGDCDDNDPYEFPGQTWYEDKDDDGYTSGTIQIICERPAGYKVAIELASTTDLDCDDNNPNVTPNPECTSTIRIWTGIIDTDWDTPCNWSPNCVPTANDDVTIPDVMNNPIIGSSTVAFAKSVNVETDGQLTINQSGSLTVDNSIGTGICVSSSGQITNNGSVNVTNTGDYGLRNAGLLSNGLTGELSIDNTVNDGINSSSSFTNQGQINIGQNGGTDNIGKAGITNFGQFDNNGGTINISEAMTNGILNAGGSPIFNNDGGTLNISHVLEGINTIGNFNNSNGGKIFIDYVSTKAIINQPASTFANGAELKIGATGSISLDGISSYGTFNNSGQLSIEGTGAHAFENAISSYFNNLACGSVQLFDDLNNAGTSTNDGLFKVDATDVSVPGNFTNNGILQDVQGTFPHDGANFTNNELIIGPVSSNCNFISAAFVIGTPVDFTFHGIYTDEAATISAGTFDANTNTFTPNVPGGSYTFYIKLEDSVNGCEWIIPFDVTFGDYDAPVPDVLSLPTLMADCSLSENEIQVPTATDACVGSIDATTSTSLEFSQQGTYTITWNYDDGNGNTISQSQTVIIDDVTQPVPNCKTNTLVELDANGSHVILEGDVFDGGTDNCGTVNFVSASPATLNCSNAGNTVSITVTVNDGNGNENTCVATVNVEDNSLPQPTCFDPTVELDATGNYALQQSDVFGGGSDNCSTVNFLSMSPTSMDCGDVGAPVPVTVTVFDASGNQTTCTATVTVEDNEMPQVTCLDPTVQLDANGSYTLSENEVFGGGTDNCGNVSFISMSPSLVDCSDIGSPVTVTVTAEDANGNQNNCTATVTVEDNMAPTALCQDLTVQLGANGNAPITATQVDNGSSDNCGVASASLDVFSFTCPDVGVNTVALTVIDVNGNSATCTATVTVEDNVAPIAECITTTMQVTLGANGEYIVDPDNLDNGSSDACGIQSLSASPSLLDCQNAGSNTVTLLVTDVNGNSSTCEVLVEVTAFLTIDNVATTDETCDGMGDGSIAISATSGGGQIGYSIDGGANFQFSGTFANLTPGTYSIVVKTFGIPSICDATGNATIGGGYPAQVWYKDMDADNYSDGTSMFSCTQPPGYYLATDLTATSGDCDDSDPIEFPSQVWYADSDGDGYTDGITQTACARPTGFKAASELVNTMDMDCDDNDAAVHPNATEICNGLDDDCDGEVDEGTSGGLTYVGNIMFSSQADVDGFSQCYSVIDGSLTINGTGINDLSNLSNLEEVTGNVTIQYTSLSSMNGLGNLVEIGGTFLVFFNSSLTTLDGLETLGAVGASLYIYYNFSLSDGCAIYNLVNGGVGGAMVIYLNTVGCNSVAEINANCAPNPLISGPNNYQATVGEALNPQNGDRRLESPFKLFPNPAVHHATIRFDDTTGGGRVLISDIAGRKVFEETLVGGTHQIELDLSGWKAGTYFVQLETEGGKRMTERLIVLDNG